uniref:Uncharacterized protein n=1 Tax=Timema shepardi TaxID=629360 RepID=A0A7R9G545_TIMSH|nr:unnamed protein product [Timema shepardi]
MVPLDRIGVGNLHYLQTIENVRRERVGRPQYEINSLKKPVPHYDKYNHMCVWIVSQGHGLSPSAAVRRERRTASSVAVQGPPEPPTSLSLSHVVQSAPPYDGHWVQRGDEIIRGTGMEGGGGQDGPSQPPYACISGGDCILFMSQIYEYMHGDYRVHLDIKVLATHSG